MPAPDIHIDRIRIDLRGISPDVAREGVASLGPALHAALAGRISRRSVGGDAQLEHVAAPTIRLPAGADSAALCHALAAQLANTIAGQHAIPAAPSPAAR